MTNCSWMFHLTARDNLSIPVTSKTIGTYCATSQFIFHLLARQKEIGLSGMLAVFGHLLACLGVGSGIWFEVEHGRIQRCDMTKFNDQPDCFRLGDFQLSYQYARVRVFRRDDSVDILYLHSPRTLIYRPRLQSACMLSVQVRSLRTRRIHSRVPLSLALLPKNVSLISPLGTEAIYRHAQIVDSLEWFSDCFNLRK